MVSKDLGVWGGCEREGGMAIEHSRGTSAYPSQHRPMQICGLKINTARKETSHRENQYPAKDNGNPVQAAVICPPNISTCRGQQSMLVNGQLSLQLNSHNDR